MLGVCMLYWGRS